MTRWLLPSPDVVPARQAQHAVERLRKRIAQSASIGDAYEAAFRTLKGFFTSLGTPTLQRRFLHPKAFRNKEDMEETFREMQQDLAVLFADSRSLSESAAQFFNLQQSMEQALQHRLDQVTSKSLDLRILTRVRSNRLVVAGDDFVDSSRIDAAATGVSGLEVINGNLVLRRVESINQAVNGTVTDVTFEKLPQDSVQLSGKKVTIGIPYEGRFYGVLDDIEPEGDSLIFDFGTRLRTETEPREKGSGVQTSQFDLSISPAPKEKLQRRRQAMIDGDPDSYWQAERVIDLPEQIQVKDFAAFDPNEYQKALHDRDVLIDQQLKTRKQLQATIEIDLGPGPQELEDGWSVNWVNVNPLNFHAREWITVDEISTKGPRDDNFTKVEHVADGRFANVLTDEANRLLDDEQVSSTLSPNRFEFAGQGVFVFEPRIARHVRITISQKNPYLIPYEVLSMEFTKTTLIAVSHRSSSGHAFSRSHRGWSIVPITETLDVKIPYVHSLAIAQGAITFDELKTPESTPGQIQPSQADIVKDILESIPELPPDQGWTYKRMTGSRLQTDKARYAVGIREIGIFSNTYEVTGQIVSVPFKASRPISKISLEVDQQTLPDLFRSDRSWIEYFISVDDGVTWLSILPVLDPDRSGTRIPKIYEINSSVPEGERDPRKGYIDTKIPVASVRMKIQLSRPDDVPNAQYFTPVLQSYRLRLSMERPL